jgi:hypothetical protein
MPSFHDDDWVSDDDIEALGLEKAVHGDESMTALAERMLVEAAPMAARTIVHLATNPGTNDRVRLTAAQYIMDRTCGKIGEGNKNEDGKAVWDDVFDAVTVEQGA